ncbi:hypothetical protein G3N59_05410 [Paraburkholderia sp. Ac-20340]|uniref:phage tail assembly protein T n=1 Tax=Paraburkholderia sp. Ac-20340 TaxID=2703888 RepID=UPI001980DCE5|nr:hypothetical protein [Paraburkholderia sp. Ac-20340]MBN3852813.1 hypothetical protein [Paraburkholderia sp. Ac-20340]
MSVRRCQQEIDSAEFAEWIAHHRIRRWGSEFEELRAGMTAATILNVNRDSKKRPRPYGPDDAFFWMKSQNEKPAIEIDSAGEFNPKAQTNLLRAKLFGKSNAAKNRSTK